MPVTGIICGSFYKVINMKPIKTRREAAESGESKYWTGKLCKHGHESERYTATGVCCKCNLEAVKRHHKNINKLTVSRLQGHFAYPLHPDDYAAALAYCQALDLSRGRAPHDPGAKAERFSREFDPVQARTLAFGKSVELGHKEKAPAAPYYPAP